MPAAEENMSSSHDAGHDSHEGPIKTPRQLIWVVALSFIVPVLIIYALVNFVASGKKTSPGTDALASTEAVAQRIAPIARVVVKDPGDVAAMKNGEQVYAAQCSACHNSGAANAPKLGDTAAWGARIKTGYETLLNSSLKGKGAMGAQGGGDFSDYEVARAVVYMVNKSGGKFDEPKAPAAPAAAPK
jgi:cytochrome c5